MPKLALLVGDAEKESYRALLEKENLPALEIFSQPDPGCEIAFGAPNLIRGALDALPYLKWAQSIWAGVEPLLDDSLRRDYVLTNAREIFGGLMAEYVFGHLLYREKRIELHRQAQKEKRWLPKESGALRGKTLGLLGVGSIGARLAETAKHFGMKTRGYTRESESCPHVDRYYHGGELLDFARELDYLVCVLPRTKETDGIVSAALLDALPPRAVFINVGRGNAVDESALLKALREGKLAAAALDVFQQEPLPPQHPFWDAPNLHITFHTAALSYPEDVVQIFAENYALYLEGKPLKHRVDFERGY